MVMKAEGKGILRNTGSVPRGTPRNKSQKGGQVTRGVEVKTKPTAQKKLG